MSKYEVRSSTHGNVRIAEFATGATVVRNGRVLDGLSYSAAKEIVGLLERHDKQRATRVAMVRSGNDLGAILDLNRETAGEGLAPVH